MIATATEVDRLGRLEMLKRRRAARRECGAFLKEHLGLLYRVAGSYEAEPARREDLLQEIALAIWTAAGRFESRSSFKTFALRIAHNRAITPLHAGGAGAGVGRSVRGAA